VSGVLSLALLALLGQVRLQDETDPKGLVSTINCSGAGITCTRSGSVGTLTVAGGGSPNVSCESGQALFWNGSVYSCVSNVTSSTSATSAESCGALASNPADCGANQFCTGTGSDAACVCAQPSFSSLSGSATSAQLPSATSAAKGAVLVPAAGCNATSQKVHWDGTAFSCGTDQTSAGGGYNTIIDEATPLTQRTDLIFTGDGVAVSDNGAETVVEIDDLAALATDLDCASCVNLASEVGGTLPLANITDGASASQCLLSGGAGGDPAWGACGGSAMGYVEQVATLNAATTTDAQVIYVGCALTAPTATAAISRCYVPKAGTLKVAYVYARATTAGTAEAWTCNIRKNNTTDTAIATVSASAQDRVWSNTGLSIAVVAGDYFEVKCTNPTWATNPANVTFMGVVYIE
jgi:hypothetical protein